MADPVTWIATAVANFLLETAVAVGVTSVVALNAILYGTIAVVSGLIYAGAAMLMAPTIPHPERGHQNFKQSVPKRRRGYGRARIAGSYALYEAYKGKAYLVHALHHGRIGGIIQHYLHDDEVTLDASGFVFGIDGKYGQAEGIGLAADKVQIFTRLGLDTETAYSEIVADLPTFWTNDHRGDRVASTAMIVKAPKEAYQAEVFPNGLPQHSIEADLAVVWDWRNGGQAEATPSTWATSRNPFVNLRDLICGSVEDGCMGEDYDRRIVPSLDYWTAAADDADSSIAKVGGTETKYEIGGFYDFDNHPADVIGEILRSCDGWMAEAGDGSLLVRSGVYYEPTITLTDRVITDYAFQRFLPDQDACNELLITYADPAQGYIMAECDPWRDEADIDARGIERTDQFELRWVQRHTQARRLAKREMLRRQAPTRGTIKTNLYGLRALGERYIGIQISEIPALNDIVAEVIRADIDLQAGAVTFSFIEADPDMDAWDPATEEGNVVAPVVRPDNPSDVPVITGHQVVFQPNGVDGYSARAMVFLEDADREDVTYRTRWRVQGGTAWTEEAPQDGYRTTWDEDAEAFFDTFVVDPGDDAKLAWEAWIVSVKEKTWWSKVGWISRATHEEASSLVNIKNPSQAGTVSGGPVFTAYEGFTGDGVDAYIALGVAPNAIPGWTQNDNLLAVDVLTAGGTGVLVGAESASGLRCLYNPKGATVAQARAGNGGTTNSGSNPTSRAGLSGVMRRTSTELKFFEEGTIYSTVANVSDGTSAQPVTILRLTSAFATDEVRGWVFGASFSDAELTEFVADWDDLTTALAAL